MAEKEILAPALGDQRDALADVDSDAPGVLEKEVEREGVRERVTSSDGDRLHVGDDDDVAEGDKDHDSITKDDASCVSVPLSSK